MNFCSSVGLCYPSAAHSHTYDDPQLLLHNTQSAGPWNAAVPWCHAAVLTLTLTQSRTREPRFAPRPSQQPSQPRFRHAIVLHIVQRTDATAAAAVQVSEREAE